MLNNLLQLVSFDRVLLVASALAFAVLVSGHIPSWRDASHRRGGQWFLEAQIYTVGLGASLATFSDLTPYSSGGAMFWLSSLLGLIATAHCLRGGGVQSQAILLALIAFYLGLIFSTIGGVEPAFPRHYWAVPLVVLPFVWNIRYTMEWLLNQVRYTLRSLVLLGFGAAIILPEYAFNTADTERNIFGVLRLSGILPHPNAMAIVGAMLVLAEIQRKRSSLWIALALLAMILAQSTTAWIGLALALPFLSSGAGTAIRRLIATASVFVIVGAIIFPLALSALIVGLLPRNWETFTGRTAIWRAALRGYDANPIFGWGPNLLDENYRARWLPNFDAAGQAHNQVVQSISGEGLVGLVGLLILITTLAVASLYAWRSTSGLAAAYVALLITRMATETPLRPSSLNSGVLMIIATVSLVAVGLANKRSEMSKTVAERVN